MFKRIFIIKNSLFKLNANYRNMSNNLIRIGVCQLNSRDDKEENFKIGEKLLNQAKKEEAKVCF
jgi:hypothetical protein